MFISFLYLSKVVQTMQHVQFGIVAIVLAFFKAVLMVQAVRSRASVSLLESSSDHLQTMELMEHANAMAIRDAVIINLDQETPVRSQKFLPEIISLMRKVLVVVVLVELHRRREDEWIELSLILGLVMLLQTFADIGHRSRVKAVECRREE